MAKESRNVHINVTTNAGKNLTKGTVAAKGLSTSLKGVAGAAQAATGGIRSMTMALISSGVGAVVVAIGLLVAGLGSVVNNARGFAKELSKLGAVTGATDAELKMLSESAKQLGASTQFTAQEVVQLQTEFAKLGFSTDEILNVTGSVLDLAAATGTDLAEAAAVAGSTMRAFGMDSSEMLNITNVMAKSFSTSALDMTKFTESMKLVAPISSVVGISLEETTAALGLLADRGLSGSLAGNALKRMFGELKTKVGGDLQTSLGKVSEMFDKAGSKAEKLAIATNLVGERSKGALIALAENRGSLDDLTKSLENANGAANDMANKALDNLDGDLTKLSSAWDGLMLSIDDGQGVFSDISRSITQGLTNSLSDAKLMLMVFSDNWKTMIDYVGTKGTAVWGQVGSGLSVLGNVFKLFGAEIMMAVADVPFIGSGIDKDKWQKEKEDIEANLIETTKLYQKFSRDSEMAGIEADLRASKRREAQAVKNKEAAEKQAKIDFDGSEERLAGYQKYQKMLSDIDKKIEDAAADTAKKKSELEFKRNVAEINALDIYESEKNELIAKQRELLNTKLASIDDKARQKEKEKIAAEEQREKERKEAKIVKDQQDVDKILNQLKVAKEDAEAVTREEQLILEEERKILELEKLNATEAEKDAVRQYYEVARKDERAKQELNIEQELATAKQKFEDIKVQAMKGAFNLIGSIAGKSKALQAAALIGENATGIAKQIISTKAANAAITAKYALIPGGEVLAQVQKRINNVSMGMGIAASVAATAKGLSALGQGGATGGSTPATTDSVTSSAAPRVPDFNVLGQTSNDANLVTGAISQANNRPIQAFVVEGDITSTQALVRNANSNASIGG